MLGRRLNPPSPFWLEDLMFLVIDETRRLPARATAAMAAIRRTADRIAAIDPTQWTLRKPVAAGAADVAAAPRYQEVLPLDEPEEWTLATEPLIAAEAGTEAAAALHRAASEQLDAVTYAFERMRDELRAMMIYTPIRDDTVHHLHDEKALESNIEALLELARRNAATRPKDRAQTAA